MMTAFLDELEPLTHRERMRRMVELGKRSTVDPIARQRIDELFAHDNAYARLLAVASCYGSREAARVMTALTDRSRLVRGRARKLVPLVCSDDEAAKVLASAQSGRERVRLATALRRRGRAAPVDAFLASQLARGPDARAVDLLALGSEDAFVRHAEAFRQASSPSSWRRLARWHARAAAAELARSIGDGASSTPIDPRLRWQMSAPLAEIARRAPDAAIDLVKRLFARGIEPADGVLRAPLGVLVRRRPCETFDLLRARHESGAPAMPPGAFGVVRFDQGAHRLGVARLAYLMEHGWSALPDGNRGRRWLLRLAEDDRARVIEAWLKRGRGSWGAFILRHVPREGPLAAAREVAFKRWVLAASSHDGVITLRLLEHLPADLRIREARRHLADVRVLATKPDKRTPYAELLPFAEARDELAAWLGHPEGEQRAQALRPLLGSVRFDRATLSDALAAVRARKFEQDPVRLAMLDTLAGLPLRCFSKECLDEVGAIVQDALDAADLSTATAAAVERLVVRLFRLDAVWGARWLTKLLETRGSVSSLGLGKDLTEREVLALAPVLAELATTWRTRERASALLWLAASFHKRVAVLPALLDALEKLASEMPFVAVAGSALGLLATHARARFAALVPELVRADPSFAILAVVSRWLSRARQDLLGPLLGDAPMTGRFATGRTHWVIDFGGGYARWTERQQLAHARALAALTSETTRDVPTLRQAIGGLARLAFAPPDASLALAADRRPPVREMAVRALPWLDGGQGVPVLVECLGDDRARWAIYALRKVFREMDAPRVVAMLRSVPTNKVTVAKEVVRLLGELGGEEAFADLCAMDVPGLHRDVRIALLRALWDHLDRPDAWAIFESAAGDPDWVLASRLADIPTVRLSSEAEAKLARLLVRVLARPEVDARFELLRRIAYVPLRDLDRTLFRECLARMGSAHVDECRIATAAALQRMLGVEAAEVAARIGELLAKRRLTAALLDELGKRLGPYAPAHVRQIGESVLAVLADDRLAVPHYLGFAPKLLDWDTLAAALVRFAGRDLLHADAMIAAMQAVTSCLHPELLESKLASHRDERLRRLALAALESAAGPGRGWSRERRERLDRYRTDASALVAGAAAFVFPPE